MLPAVAEFPGYVGRVNSLPVMRGYISDDLHGDIASRACQFRTACSGNEFRIQQGQQLIQQHVEFESSDAFVGSLPADDVFR